MENIFNREESVKTEPILVNIGGPSRKIFKQKIKNQLMLPSR
jgi:hypothetical protein